MVLRDYFTPLLRWWWLLVLAVLVAGGFSYLAASQQAPIYQTRATLMVGSAIASANPQYEQIFYADKLISTYVDIANRKPVQEGVMQALGLDWLPAYSVTAVNTTQLIEIKVTDTDAGRAQAVANELAHQLILQSPTASTDVQGRQEFINSELDRIESAISETQAEIDAKQKELGNLTSARQIADVQNQIYSLQSKQDTLRMNYTELLANSQGGAANSLMLIESAEQPEIPIGPNVPLQVVTACTLALVLATGAVYLLAFMDNTVKSAEEIKRLTGLPMLAAIPVIEGEKLSDKLITVNEPRSPIAETYRSLRTAVQFSNIDRPNCKAILVTSSAMSEGKSLTTANLAAVFAQAGLRVLLVDADLRRPMAHRALGMDNRTGMTLALSELSPQSDDSEINRVLSEHVRSTEVDSLWLLSSGPLPPNPSELLGSETFQRMVDGLKQRFDYLIIDSPPVLMVTDAVVLSTMVDGVVMVIDARTTQRNQLRQVVEMLQAVNARLIGVVANRLSASSDRYFSNYTYYHSYDPNFGYKPAHNGGSRSKVSKLLEERRKTALQQERNHRDG